MDLFQLPQNSGMERTARTRLIGTVDRQVVLDQIVRSEAEEIHFRRHEIAGLGRSWRLDHDSHRNSLIEVDALLREPATDIRDDVVGFGQLIKSGNERKYDPRVAVGRRPGKWLGAASGTEVCAPRGNADLALPLRALFPSVLSLMPTSMTRILIGKVLASDST